MERPPEAVLRGPLTLTLGRGRPGGADLRSDGVHRIAGVSVGGEQVEQVQGCPIEADHGDDVVEACGFDRGDDRCVGVGVPFAVCAAVCLEFRDARLYQGLAATGLAADSPRRRRGSSDRGLG